MLRRKIGESIIIDDHIKVTVTEVDDSGKALLGIQAPKDISVDREEIYFKKMKDQINAQGEGFGNR